MPVSIGVICWIPSRLPPQHWRGSWTVFVPRLLWFIRNLNLYVFFLYRIHCHGFLPGLCLSTCLGSLCRSVLAEVCPVNSWLCHLPLVQFSSVQFLSLPSFPCFSACLLLSDDSLRFLFNLSLFGLFENELCSPLDHCPGDAPMHFIALLHYQKPLPLFYAVIRTSMEKTQR